MTDLREPGALTRAHAAAAEERYRWLSLTVVLVGTLMVVLDTTINTIGAHPMSRKPTAGFDARATIKRSDFGLGMHVPHVADEIELHITTEASAAAE